MLRFPSGTMGDNCQGGAAQVGLLCAYESVWYTGHLRRGHILNLQGPIPHPPKSEQAPNLHPNHSSVHLPTLPPARSFPGRTVPLAHPAPQDSAGQCWEDSHAEMTWPQQGGSPASPFWPCPPNNQGCQAGHERPSVSHAPPFLFLMPRPLPQGMKERS